MNNPAVVSKLLCVHMYLYFVPCLLLIVKWIMATNVEKGIYKRFGNVIFVTSKRLPKRIKPISWFSIPLKGDLSVLMLKIFKTTTHECRTNQMSNSICLNAENATRTDEKKGNFRLKLKSRKL